MKIFSKHRKKVEAHRRYGSREFKDKLNTAKNYKRFDQNAQKGFIAFFTKTGLSQIGTFTAVLTVGAVVYFLTLSPYFRITQIAISGNNQVTSDTIQAEIKALGSKRFLFVPENSLFVLSNKRLTKLFASNLPEIAEVKTHRSWPDKITIEVKERNPAVVLTVSGRNYLVDDQGFVIKQIDTPSNLFHITDQVDEEIKTGEVISGNLVPFVISLEKQWPTKITTPITSAKIPGKGATEGEFVSSDGWSVFFSTDASVANQLHSLSLIMSQAVNSSQRSNLAYIDLRLADRAYLCMKSSPCQQTTVPQAAAATNTETTVTPQTNGTGN